MEQDSKHKILQVLLVFVLLYAILEIWAYLQTNPEISQALFGALATPDFFVFVVLFLIFVIFVKKIRKW